MITIMKKRPQSTTSKLFCIYKIFSDSDGTNFLTRDEIFKWSWRLEAVVQLNRLPLFLLTQLNQADTTPRGNISDNKVIQWTDRNKERKLYGTITPQNSLPNRGILQAWNCKYLVLFGGSGDGVRQCIELSQWYLEAYAQDGSSKYLRSRFSCNCPDAADHPARSILGKPLWKY